MKRWRIDWEACCNFSTSSLPLEWAGNKQTRQDGRCSCWPEQRLPHTELPTCSAQLVFFLGRGHLISRETRAINQIGSAFASVVTTSLIQITNQTSTQLNPDRNKTKNQPKREIEKLLRGEWANNVNGGTIVPVLNDSQEKKRDTSGIETLPFRRGRNTEKLVS